MSTKKNSKSIFYSLSASVICVNVSTTVSAILLLRIAPCLFNLVDTKHFYFDVPIREKYEMKSGGHCSVDGLHRP